MTLFETGRLCVKTAGREAGSLCVVLDKAEKDYVLVTGPKVLSGVRKRKCNIEHLEPLPNKIKIKPDASDSEILDHLKKEEDVLKKFDLKVPTAEEIKKMEAQRAERIAKKAERKVDADKVSVQQDLEKAKKEKAAQSAKKEEKPAAPKAEAPKTPEKKEDVPEKTKEEKPKEAKPKKESKPKAEKKKE